MEVLSDAIRLFGVEPPKQLALWATLVSVAVTVPIGALFYLNSRPRQQNLPVYRERVLILGGSSGIGEATAVAYARRGCRSLVIVGRRAEELERVRVKCEQAAKEGDEWTQADKAPGWEERMGKPRVWTFKADCTSPEDVLRIREFVEQSESSRVLTAGQGRAGWSIP